MRNAPAPKKTQLRAWSLNVKFHFAFINPDCWGKNYLCSNMVPQMVRNSVSFTVCIQSNLIYVQSTYIYINLSIYIYIYIYYLAPFYFYSVSTADELQTPEKLFECVWPFWIHDTTKFSSMFLAILFSCYTYFPVNIRLQERHNYAKIASNVNITCFLKYNNVIDSFAKNLHHRRFTWSWIRFCFQ